MRNIKEKGYEHYVVNTDGIVYNTITSSITKKPLDKLRLLKSYPNKNTGYMTVVLRNGIKPKCVYVHRLVASAYLPNPFNLPEVNHKDFVVSNNKLSNLEWVTVEQNIQHSVLNKPKSIDNLLKQKSLIKKGIEHYELNKDMNYLSKLWNICKPICSEILHMHKVELTRYRLPNIIVKHICNDIKNNAKPNPNYMKDKLFIKHIIETYKVDFTQHILNKLKKNLKNQVNELF
jgi:hypothetical protein